MKIVQITLAIITSAMLLSCNQNKEKMENTKQELEAIFPKGELGSKDLFTGNAYFIGLVDADSTFTTAIGNVYFEPGARSNWHSHPAGQILIITDGIGYHQIEGKPIEIIKKGDVIKCPPNVRHWHGASADVGLQQLYIIPNTEKGIVEWKEAVTDEQYSANKK
ncbi:cupin domain-containing protein [Flavobacterium sp. LB2P84]|uniref:Cupin domain-containing protein n=1 Tax=Flavobacterium yafengii TaxID=3041253 RepID=A0AAW6TLU2_9FLAO|nr:cupin domain-containing protein [Flavobacterium yafengii]MDI5949411.1 cupin domain-containing protein [Flavobacterium yafengii]MDI6031534.1 cupin domain-containing protein [Flavobacterium yafengii]